MSQPTYFTQDISGAIIARAWGRFDKAVFILEEQWQSKEKEYVIGIELVKTLRGLSRDIFASDSLTRKLGNTPGVQNRAFDAIDPTLVNELRAGGCYDRLRRAFRGHWMAHLVDLCEVDDSLAISDLDTASKLLSRIAPDRLPVPWHFLSARVALIRGNTEGALDAIAIAIGINHNARQFYLLLGQILTREGRLGEAGESFLRAGDLYDDDFLFDTRRSILPLSICRRYCRRQMSISTTNLSIRIEECRRFMQLTTRIWSRLSRQKYRFKRMFGSEKH